MEKVAFFVGHARVPAARAVVVVSAGVDDGVSIEVVGQEAGFGGAAEGELQDAHARHAELAAQGIRPVA